MEYQATLKYLESLIPVNFKQDLVALSEACHLFDNPSLAFPTIHIAGTNGKGSTATFLTSILMHSGYKVGLYTSPHLIDVRERIQVNRQPISEQDFVKLTEEIRKVLPNERYLTYFEFLTLMSFLYFKQQKVDIAVFETGLGGRLDATNVIKPQVAIITSISFDHRHHLGASLADIAKEKCGIIKRGVPTVVAEQQNEVMDVVRRWCDDQGSPLCVAHPADITQPLGLLGKHQKQNASCAVEAAQLLSAMFKIKKVDEALLNTHWSGRLEQVNAAPKVLVDGAHNLAGAQVLAEYISETIPRDKVVLMIGIMQDKDIKGICRVLAPTAKEIICVRAPIDRSASPKDIAAAARSYGAEVHVEEEVAQALATWLKKLKKQDILIISGSLMIVAEAKKYFDKA
ncbi:MAG: folylpolyglutamate synthase/dihydrofolate synthase family protein [Pseudomonadota bacterium]